jgi:hypothetical protein
MAQHVPSSMHRLDPVTVKLDRSRLVVVNPTAKDAETVAGTTLVNHLKLAQADGEGERDRGARLVGNDVVLRGCGKPLILLVDGTTTHFVFPCPLPPGTDLGSARRSAQMDTPREGGETDAGAHHPTDCDGTSLCFAELVE